MLFKSSSLSLDEFLTLFEFLSVSWFLLGDESLLFSLLCDFILVLFEILFSLFKVLDLAKVGESLIELLSLLEVTVCVWEVLGLEDEFASAVLEHLRPVRTRLEVIKVLIINN